MGRGQGLWGILNRYCRKAFYVYDFTLNIGGFTERMIDEKSYFMGQEVRVRGG
jgi:hypothetical protein